MYNRRDEMIEGCIHWHFFNNNYFIYILIFGYFTIKIVDHENSYDWRDVKVDDQE